MVTLKHNSLNSRSLQTFKSSSQKTAAVINNPKQLLSFSVPYCPQHKQGRKVSVVPSLWEICVPQLPPGSVTVLPSCPCHCVPCSHQQHKGVSSPTAQCQRSSCTMLLDCNMHKQEKSPKMQQPRAGGEALSGHGGSSWQHRTSLQNPPAPNTLHRPTWSCQTREKARKSPKQAEHLWVERKN